MDYFEEPRELVSNVIKMNPTTGPPSVMIWARPPWSTSRSVIAPHRPPTAHRGADNQRTSDQVDLTC